MRYINPCHECGGKNVGYTTLVVYGTPLARVVCDECGAVGPWHVGLDKAAEAWNDLYNDSAAITVRLFNMAAYGKFDRKESSDG